MDITINMQAYADGIIDKLIAIKDSNKDNLTRNEIDTINNACNLIEHNREDLKVP